MTERLLGSAVYDLYMCYVRGTLSDSVVVGQNSEANINRNRNPCSVLVAQRPPTALPAAYHRTTLNQTKPALKLEPGACVDNTRCVVCVDNTRRVPSLHHRSAHTHPLNPLS